MNIILTAPHQDVGLRYIYVCVCVYCLRVQSGTDDVYTVANHSWYVSCLQTNANDATCRCYGLGGMLGECPSVCVRVYIHISRGVSLSNLPGELWHATALAVLPGCIRFY